MDIGDRPSPTGEDVNASSHGQIVPRMGTTKVMHERGSLYYEEVLGVSNTSILDAVHKQGKLKGADDTYGRARKWPNEGLSRTIESARHAVNVTLPGYESTIQMKMLAGLNGRNLLSWDARYRHEATVKLLLDAGKLDVDSKDSYSRTLLAWAVQYGRERTVKQLLDTGKVNVDSEDEDGQTLRAWADENGHKAIADQLLNRRIDKRSK